MLAFLKTYDWEEAFAYANGEWCVGSGRETEKPVRFTRDDVAEVVAYSDGYNDGDAWLCLGRLKSGPWFYLTAWCDYTGWDCQAGGRAYVAPKKAMLVEMVLDATERERLGMAKAPPGGEK